MASSRHIIRSISARGDRIRTLTFRQIARYGFALIGVSVALAIAALLLAGPFDIAPIVARHAALSLGRPVTIAAMRVHFGAAVRVELRGLVIDNRPGGSQPRMLEVAEIDAEIAPWPLILWALPRHALMIRHLDIKGVRLLLEHTADDQPNWHFNRSVPSHANPRSDFPTLLDASIHDVEIDLRPSSGHVLRMLLGYASIASSGVTQPIALTASGAYNTTPLQLAATLRSFDELHDAALPFGMNLHFSSGDTTLEFVGTMTDPLNADGADGRVALDAPTWNRLLGIAGIGAWTGPPLTLSGPVNRLGDLWRLTGASGTLRGHEFQADFQLREGARRAPDELTLNAAFSTVDLTGLPMSQQPGEMTLRIDADPGTLLDADVTAKHLVRGALRADDVELKVKLAPGSLVIAPLTLRVAGGKARIDATLRNTGTSATMQVDAALTSADAGQIAGVLGTGPLPLTGAVDARAQVNFGGNTVTDAGRSNRGVVIVSMHSGAIERKIMEGASTDLRLLFRSSAGSAQIHCLLGILDLRDGVGRVAPLRIKTSEGTIAGAGTFDLRDNTIDVIVASESASTGLFALDLPMRIAGAILDPHVSPAALSAGNDPAKASVDPRDMPAALLALVRGDRCFLAGGR